MIVARRALALARAAAAAVGLRATAAARPPGLLALALDARAVDVVEPRLARAGVARAVVVVRLLRCALALLLGGDVGERGVDALHLARDAAEELREGRHGVLCRRVDVLQVAHGRAVRPLLQELRLEEAVRVLDAACPYVEALDAPRRGGAAP